MQISNQQIIWQNLEPSIRMRQKGDLNDFERGMVVGATLALFQKLLNYCYFHAQPSRLQRMKKI